MKRVMIIIGSLIAICLFCGICFAGVLVFPVDGLLGDSYYPRDSGEATAKGARKNYTTVWSGKYEGMYQNRHKSTGGHPGMDIIGAVGEKIYAITDGKIVYAHCYNETSWGNLVVIEHLSSQFNEGSAYNYYSIYAHLRQINVTENDVVKAGDIIGLMGGAINDPCHGNSSGRHLHFQIEKKMSWDNPFWPPNNNGNTPDPTNLNANTVDPIAFIELKYSFFVGKSATEGWKFEDSAGTFQSEPFVDCYRYNGGMELLGYPTNNAYLCTYFPGYYQYDGSPAVYVQDLNKNGHIFTLVLNPYVWNIRMNYLGVVYPIHGQIRDYWRLNYSHYGPPVSNEYFDYVNGVKYVVQWFEPSDNNFKKITYNTGNGRFNDAASASLTYGDHLNQAVVKNLGCTSMQNCGVGGGEIPDPDPIPVSSEWTLIDQAMAPAINSGTNEPIEREENFPIATGSYAYYWAKLSSTNPEIGFEWKWYYQDPEDSENWIQISSPIEQVYVNYNPSEQEYIVWFRLDMMKCQTVGLRKAELIGVGRSVKVAGNLYFNAEIAMPKDTLPRAPVLRIIAD